MLSSIFLIGLWQVAAAEDGSKNGGDTGEEDEPQYAVLFPWFVEILGVVVFFMANRYFKLFPYTAVMFLLGTFMGIGVARLNSEDQLSTSIKLWEMINSEVLLLVFLPGLVFNDAYGLNVHLFQVSLYQCLILAFPMVLAGTALVACVAYFVFPYGWSFNLAMTFGSILSATDPVAVSSLLSAVGAPPRLTMLISGESLLNDGSAIVFFTIFSGMYLSEIGPEYGEDVNVGEGFALFFRMFLGGACIGLAFGMGLVAILYLLNRQLDAEENVVQVASTITIAYLCYYIADSVAHTSGVIAVVFCGVFTKAFGNGLVNDLELMESFWVLVDHLLNTLLFTLGGVVWGTIISNNGERELFSGKDWGYLFLLYILLNAIRFFLFGAFYPIVSRIGLKTNWQEAVFMSYSGLRGAVGISLAIALDDEVFQITTDPAFRLETSKLFGMVGGIAFLTLFINGTTAGYVLEKLGLTSGSKLREKLTAHYYQTIKGKILDDFVRLLSHPVFADIDFALVRHHVPYLNDLTPETLKEAVLKNKINTPAKDYHKPNLDKIIPYLLKSSGTTDFDTTWVKDLETYEKEECDPLRPALKESEGWAGDLERLQKDHGDNDEVKELRLIFLEIVRASYAQQIERGLLDPRAGGSPGFVGFSLEQGIEFSMDSVRNRRSPLNDWESSYLVNQPIVDHGAVLIDRICVPLRKYSGKTIFPLPESATLRMTLDVNRAFAFLEAHLNARRQFEEEFSKDGIDDYETLIILESKAESEKAQALLNSLNKDDVRNILAHNLCIGLLSKASRIIERFYADGLLKQQEATQKTEELEHRIDEVRRCSVDRHPGEFSQHEMQEIMQQQTTNGT